MKTYRISFDLIVEDGHPRKWVPDAIWANLNPDAGEDCDNWTFEEVVTEKEAE
jgi:hypothetical protein